METRILTAHVPAVMADKVDEIAARLERPHAWVVEQALAAWIEREDERRRLTLEGMADLDCGRLVDHAAVQAWADSLGTGNELPMPRAG